MENKKILASLQGETFKVPPVWLMRQAGRYLPEYRETRKNAGGFLDLCFNSDLATEVTLQPIRRYNFDAAILFADILLIPKALGMNVWFAPGEGPRLDGINEGFSINSLKKADDIHDTLLPIYQTVKNLSEELPKETALIGFAGAPWTVATYMINGRGSPDQLIAKKYMYNKLEEFEKLIEILTQSTIEYLSKQIDHGAEVIKIFDSWAGALSGTMVEKFSLKPMTIIAEQLKSRHPYVPIIVFPRGIGTNYDQFSMEKQFDGLAIDGTVSAGWAAKNLQVQKTVQGNLDPLLLVTGGQALKSECKHLLNTLSNGPFIFNLGHGITPDADPKNVDLLLECIRT